MTQENAHALDEHGAGMTQPENQGQPMGPGDLVSAWHEIKLQIDEVEARLTVMLGFADQLRAQLLREFNVTVPKLAAGRVQVNVDAAGPAAPPRPEELAAPPSPEELEATDPDAAAVVAAGLPVQRSVEITTAPTTTLDVAKIREEAQSEGEDPGQFAAGIEKMMQLALRTIK